MTTKQRLSILIDRWPKACQLQHWNPHDRPLRLQVIGQAVGREITTLNDLNNTDDIDKVYAHLGMLSDIISYTLETLPPERRALPAGYARILKADTPGERRRLLWLIHQHALELVMGDRLSSMNYALALARDKFHLVAGLTTLDDLSLSQLHQLMITLNARRHKKHPSQVAAPTPASALVSGPF